VDFEYMYYVEIFFNIVLMSFFWMLNTPLLSVEYPQKVIPYDMMEWK
jgi:hypothetical protein